MSPVQSIKLAVVCGTLLGAPIACLITFAQSPTPVPNSFATPTPNPTASPAPRGSGKRCSRPGPDAEYGTVPSRGSA